MLPNRSSALTARARSISLIRSSRFARLLLAAAATSAIAPIAAAQTATGWKGNGGDDLWTTAANWDNTGPNAGARDLFFGAAWDTAGRTGSTTATNTITGYSGHKIFFENIANPVSFKLQGNTITLFDFGGATPVFPQIQNNSSAAQLISVPINFNDTSGNNKAEINPVNGDLTFDNAVNLSGANTQLQIWSNNQHTVTFNAPIASSGNGGANSFAINQNSNVVINATCTYTGSTFVNAGKLQFDAGGALSSTIRLGDTSGTVSAAVDLLPVTGGFTLSRTINPRAGSTSNTLSFNSLNTSGTNTYSGHAGLDHDFLVSQSAGGTLAITQLRASPTDTLTGFDVKGFTTSFFAAGDINVSGTIYNSTGSGSIIKNGTTGVMTLSSDNTYTGQTVVNEGTLRLGAGTTSGAIAVASNVTSTGTGGTLAFNRSDSVTFANSVGGNVALAQIGSGVTVLTGNNTSTGATFIGAATLQVGAGTTTGALGSGTITNNSNLAFNRSDTVTLANPLIGTGHLSQNGSGTLALAGTHSYTGQTYVNSGTLQVNAAALLQTSEISDAAYIAHVGGTVTITGPDSLRIGQVSGQNGTYALSGSGAVLNANGISGNGSVRVGEGGNGTLLMQAGTLNSIGVMQVGINSGASGLVDHSGGRVNIGVNGAGQNSTLFVGRNSGSNGTYSISNSAALDIYGNLQVGFTGAGTFTQSGTSLVNVRTVTGGAGGAIFIANGTTAFASYTITGGMLTADNGIYIGGDAGGPGGNGTLTVGGTAIVNTGPALNVWNNGTLNLNIGGIVNLGTTVNDNLFNAGTINNNGGTLNFVGRIYGPGKINNASGNVTFANGTGVDTGDVEISGGTAVANGTLAVGRAAASNGILLITGGSTTVNGTLGVGNIGTITAGTGTGSVHISAGSLYADRVVIGSTAGGSGTVTLAAGTNQTLKLQALEIATGAGAGNAALDVNDNDAIVSNATSKSSIVNLIRSARNNGAWNASGITSTSARTQSSHVTGLGVLGGAEYSSAHGGATTFNGVSFTATDTLVKYTWNGDADFSGHVDFDDYFRIDTGFNSQTGPSPLINWFTGDFNYDDRIDFDDYALIDNAFNAQSGTLARALAYLDGSDRSGDSMGAPSLKLVQGHLAQFGVVYAQSFLAAVPEPSDVMMWTALTFMNARAMMRRRRRN